MKTNKIKFITQAALISAIYIALTLIANALGLANAAIQVRFSEALTILPVFTSAAVPGLFVGCLLSNILTGCAPWDILFGSLATLIGAIFTLKLKNLKWAASLPPIISNTIIVPFVLSYVYGAEGTIPYLMVTVAIGEIISCAVLGNLLRIALKPHKKIFKL
ncbi:MAG: QueT transporter family protein [Clostridiales bacterium]|nr:QueT transporter family protein [Clostridiales bacterium]